MKNKRNPPLSFASQYEILRPEDRVILFAIMDNVREGKRCVIRNRAMDNASIILSYAGLIRVGQEIGQQPVIYAITARGVKFHQYMQQKTTPQAQMAALPPSHPLRTLPPSQAA